MSEKPQKRSSIQGSLSEKEATNSVKALDSKAEGDIQGEKLDGISEISQEKEDIKLKSKMKIDYQKVSNKILKATNDQGGKNHEKEKRMSKKEEALNEKVAQSQKKPEKVENQPTKVAKSSKQQNKQAKQKEKNRQSEGSTIPVNINKLGQKFDSPENNVQNNGYVADQKVNNQEVEENPLHNFDSTEKDKIDVKYQRHKYDDHLKIAFEHYCKMKYCSKAPTFGQIENSCNTMMISNFITFCKDFNIHKIFSDFLDNREEQSNQVHKKTEVRERIVQLFRKHSSNSKYLNLTSFTEMMKDIAGILSQNEENLGSNQLEGDESVKMDRLMQYLSFHTSFDFSKKMNQIGVLFREKNNYHNNNVPKCETFESKYKFILTPTNGKSQEQMHYEIESRKEQRQVKKRENQKMHVKNKTNKIEELYKNGVPPQKKVLRRSENSENYHPNSSLSHSRLIPVHTKIELMPMMRKLPQQMEGNHSFLSKSRKVQRNHYNPSQILSDQSNCATYRQIMALKRKKDYDHLGRKTEKIKRDQKQKRDQGEMSVGEVLKRARNQIEGDPKDLNIIKFLKACQNQQNKEEAQSAKMNIEKKIGNIKKNRAKFISQENEKERISGKIMKNTPKSINQSSRNETNSLNYTIHAKKIKEGSKKGYKLEKMEENIMNEINNISEDIQQKKKENMQKSMRLNRKIQQIIEAEQREQMKKLSEIIKGSPDNNDDISEEEDEILKKHFENQNLFSQNYELTS